MEVLRFVASIAVTTWGLAMILLSILNGTFIWVLVGLPVAVVGLPLLASNRLAAARLYPVRNRPPTA